MTSTDLVVRQSRPLTPEEDVALRETIRDIQQTDFVPKAYRGKPFEIYACVLTGRSLGLDPFTSLRQIYMVDGKATMSAELMVALVRRAGHSITGKSSATEAMACGRRADNSDEFETSFTLDEAKAAGLLGKDNWKKYPADMLWARAVSRLCRRLFPDVLAGVSYTPDEAELSPEERNMEATDSLPLPPDEDSLREPDGGTDASSGTSGSLSEDSGPGEGAPSVPQNEAALSAGPGPEVVEPDGQTTLMVPADVRAQMERGE